MFLFVMLGAQGRTNYDFEKTAKTPLIDFLLSRIDPTEAK